MSLLKNKFILAFIGFVLFISIGLSILSIHFIKESFLLFTLSTNLSYTTILWHRLYVKMLLGFFSLVLVFVFIAIPFGLYLFKRLTNSYVHILDAFSNLARHRFELDQDRNFNLEERQLLNQYYQTLKSDYEKLKDYEKVSSFKEGARMLLHEIKNPLTPLKLGVQSLMLHAKDNSDEVQRLYLALLDIDTVLNAFRELVNIEFKPKERLDFMQFLEETSLLLEHRHIIIRSSISTKSLYVVSEAGMLRMVWYNLINNGCEANQPEFYISIDQELDSICIQFVTPQVQIEDIQAIFKLGFSKKGEARGYGLFISKQMMDYLEHELSVRQTAEGVVFCIRIKVER